MVLNGLDVLLYSVTFLVPGYILYSTLSSITPRRPSEPNSVFLRYLTLGAAHNVPWIALLYGLLGPRVLAKSGAEQFLLSHTLGVALAWVGIVFVSPFVAAVAYAKLRDWGVVEFLWRLIRLEPLHPVASAWDFGFGRGWRNVYVAVTLRDGRVFYGKYGRQSLASSSQGGRDVHIEEVWKVEDGEWQRIPDAPSVTILGEVIASVEIWGKPRVEEASGERRQREQRWRPSRWRCRRAVRGPEDPVGRGDQGGISGDCAHR